MIFKKFQLLKAFNVENRKRKNWLNYNFPVNYANHNTQTPRTAWLNQTDTFWVEVCGDEEFVSHVVGTPKLKIWQQGDDTITVDCGLYGHTEANDTLGFGQGFRHWGRFVYNTAEGRHTGAISESLLSNDYSARTDTIDASKEPFLQMSPDFSGQGGWSGANDMIWIKGDTVSTARLVVNDVSQTSPLEAYSGASSGNYAAMGFPVVTKASSNDIMASGSIGSVSGSLNTASGSSHTELMTLDMNGDGYPDLVGNKKISYTDHRGRLGSDVCAGFAQENQNSAFSLSTGGSAQYSFSTYGKNRKDGTSALSTQQAASGKNAHVSPQFDDGQGNNNDAVKSTYADVNGDGLPDYLVTSGDNVVVRLNMGYSFGPQRTLSISTLGRSASSTSSPSIGAGLGFDKWNTSFAGGIGVATTESMETAGLYDVNGDGLPDLVVSNGLGCSVSFNTGNGFESAVSPEEMSGIARNASLSTSANVAGTVAFTAFGMKTAVSLGVNHARSIARQLMALRDIDGDGFPDIVTSDSPDDMSVRYSAIRRTNKLHTVRNSLGGTFTLDYAHSAPTYGLPGGKWVLSEVTVDDGIHDDGPVQRTRYEYADGRRDRHEREFLGFGEVHAIELDTENGNAPYRRTVEEYDVSSVYSQGNLLSTAVMDADGNLYTKTTNSYYGYLLKASSSGTYSFTNKTDNNLASAIGDAGMAYCPLKFTEARQYEAGSSNGRIMSQEHYSYYTTYTTYASPGALSVYRFSDKGNMTSSGTNFTLRRTYAYLRNEELNVLRRVSNCSSYSSLTSSSMLEKTTFQYPDNNNLLLPTLIRKYITSSIYAQTNLSYDVYGNLMSMQLPSNHKNERMAYSYKYETTMNMYANKIEDSFGLKSEVQRFDYRYGVALDREDSHGKHLRTYLDAMGRPVRYVSPLEQAPYESDMPSYEQQTDLYTVKYEYHPFAQLNAAGGISKPAYAVTHHYDTKHPGDPIVTVTFVDGFGRPVQVKKESVVDGNRGYILSGKIVYDAFGRTSKAYYPTFNQNDSLHWQLGQDMVAPTRTLYDVLNRTTQVTLPDNTVSSMAYTLSSVNSQNVVVAELTDALNHKTATSTNGNGQTVRTTQYNDAGTPLNTTYMFDALGRLTKVTDTEGNSTYTSYDMLGRCLSVNHPASGTTEYGYDNAGNLVTKLLPNLIEPLQSVTVKPGMDTIVYNSVVGDATTQDLEPIDMGDRFPVDPTFAAVRSPIRYYYRFNRLDSIVYPFHPENNVYYYYGGANSRNEQSGRVALRVDGSGAVAYNYDQMGNVIETDRTVIVPNEGVFSFTTDWKYDSFGRLMRMTYPDGDHIYYYYDLGGQLQMVNGYNGNNNSTYVSDIHYNKFGQMTDMEYGNGALTQYFYNPATNRMNWMRVVTNNLPLNRHYYYNAVGNIDSVKNTVYGSAPHFSGTLTQSYTYDALDRLVAADGMFTGQQTAAAQYHQTFGYDDMYRIVAKSTAASQSDMNIDGDLYVGSSMSYSYKTRHPFQIDQIADGGIYRDQGPSGRTFGSTVSTYEYDDNGNLTHERTARQKADGHYEPVGTERKFLWDEENRLQAISENGYVSNYIYDADGERTVKMHGGGTASYLNASDSTVTTERPKYTLYASPYFTLDEDHVYVKHIYMGHDRIVSKMAMLSQDPRGADIANFEGKTSLAKLRKQKQALESAIDNNYAALGVPFKSVDYDDFEYNTNPDFSRQAQTQAEVLYYYHKDYLGSSLYLTDANGQTTQHVEYMPYGEMFVEQHDDGTWATPYRFTGKEYDEETGLIYFGARYFDPKRVFWYSTDPLQEKYPNVSSYCYTKCNPVKFIDSDGKKLWVANNEAKHLLLGVIPKTAHKYLKINKQGFVKSHLLNRGLKTINEHSNNLISIAKIAGDKKHTVRFYGPVNSYSYINAETGNNLIYNFDSPDRRNVYRETMNNYSGEESMRAILSEQLLKVGITDADEVSGNFGATLRPLTMQTTYPGGQVSTSGDVEVYVNGNGTTPIEQIVYTAHELNGHALFGILGLDPRHSEGSGNVSGASQLNKHINIVENEAREYNK